LSTSLSSVLLIFKPTVSYTVCAFHCFHSNWTYCHRSNALDINTACCRLVENQFFVKVHDQVFVSIVVGQQAGWSAHAFTALHSRDIVKPHSHGNQTSDVVEVAFFWVVPPSREVAILCRHQFHSDTIGVKTPRTVPAGDVVVSGTKSPLFDALRLEQIRVGLEITITQLFNGLLFIERNYLSLFKLDIRAHGSICNVCKLHLKTCVYRR